MLFSRSCGASRQRTQPTAIVITPSSAAGVPPRKTIARTRARKLPEILIWALVVIAVRSLKAAKAKRTSSRPMFQLPSGAATIAAVNTAASAPAWMAIILGVGRSVVIAEWWSCDVPVFEFRDRRAFPACDRNRSPMDWKKDVSARRRPNGPLIGRYSSGKAILQRPFCGQIETDRCAGWRAGTPRATAGRLGRAASYGPEHTKGAR